MPQRIITGRVPFVLHTQNSPPRMPVFVPLCARLAIDFAPDLGGDLLATLAQSSQQVTHVCELSPQDHAAHTGLQLDDCSMHPLLSPFKLHHNVIIIIVIISILVPILCFRSLFTVSLLLHPLRPVPIGAKMAL
uniref:Uncharacterized protein n=1 Tax=Chrysotila carterae TaxID=13221 RepID=A0A7S4F0L6_CHRCT|mmetsp:Transcript_4015/g.7858  ORF Transcript_4015/g.7858 Transcript_4015/m.7858 type:complete len:134 (-) Transcript_4015:747-1148(-)